MPLFLSEKEFQEQKLLCSIVGTGTAILGGSLLGGASSLLGSGKSSSASKSAANESLLATELSLQTEQSIYNQNVARLQPYVSAGYGATGPMQQIAQSSPAGVPYLAQSTQAFNQAGNFLAQAAGMTPPSVVTENWLQQTPGYQWQRGQGLQAIQAAAASRGLGVSGSSLKGAATYATGLADSNYQNQFNNAQTAWQDVINQGVQAQNLGTGFLNAAGTAQAMQQQNYNQWANLANLGESAAAQTAQSGTASSGQMASSLSTGAGQYGNYLTQAGQSSAAGTVGASSALTSGVNNYLTYSALQQALQGTQGASMTSNITPNNANYTYVVGQDAANTPVMQTVQGVPYG